MDLSQPAGENYGNPITCFFHVFFKGAALAFYIVFSIFVGNFVVIFVVTALLAALDFWVVKNVSGRILVGLRWWNEIDDQGESVWRFECLDQESMARLNKKDSWLFWWTLYLNMLRIKFNNLLLGHLPQGSHLPFSQHLVLSELFTAEHVNARSSGLSLKIESRD
ncbi:Golgi apparatus membrane protein-like protein ECHIDNA isoform X2 [Arachis duranensis]|uniref:Golgi apparatus membrane protein TVP23 n=1 Tax=Arachis duranensis TaxID=130453 RepID=A0A6P5MGK5_ARADU|nr:Golgi apparatus membrane protein-like protein ECHIDNA isoform X2 [Arachis duranensis]